MVIGWNRLALPLTLTRFNFPLDLPNKLDPFTTIFETVTLPTFDYWSEIGIVGLFITFYVRWWGNKLEVLYFINRRLYKHSVHNKRWLTDVLHINKITTDFVNCNKPCLGQTILAMRAGYDVRSKLGTFFDIFTETVFLSVTDL